MTEMINGAGDAALGWLRRNLLAILGIAAAAGFARAELAHVSASVEEARVRLEELHRDFIAFRLSGSGVTKERFVDEVSQRREEDRRLRETLAQLSARVFSVEAGMRRVPAPPRIGEAER